MSLLQRCLIGRIAVAAIQHSLHNGQRPGSRKERNRKGEQRTTFHAHYPRLRAAKHSHGGPELADKRSVLPGWTQKRSGQLVDGIRDTDIQKRCREHRAPLPGREAKRKQHENNADRAVPRALFRSVDNHVARLHLSQQCKLHIGPETRSSRARRALVLKDRANKLIHALHAHKRTRARRLGGT